MRILFSFLSILLLAACADTPKPRGKPAPDLQYSHFEKLHARGEGAVIRQSYAGGNVGHDLSIPLPALINRYLHGRFMVSLETAGFEIDVRSLHVTRERTEEGVFGGLLGGDETITAKVVLVFTPLIPGTLDQIYTLTAQRRLMINANMSLADRELAEVELLEALIGDIDRKIVPLFAPKVR